MSIGSAHPDRETGTAAGGADSTTLKSAVERAEWRRLDIALIETTENIRRTRLQEDADNLTRSISIFGVLEALLVVLLATGRYLLISGFGRLEAAKRCGLLEVPCRVFPLGTPPEVLEGARLHGNFHSPVNPLDVAMRLNEIRKREGLSQVRLAERFCIPQPRISEYLALLKLPEGDQKALAEGRLTLKQALGRAAAKCKTPMADAIAAPKRVRIRIGALAYSIDGALQHQDEDTKLLVLIASAGTQPQPLIKDALRALGRAIKALKLQSVSPTLAAAAVDAALPGMSGATEAP